MVNSSGFKFPIQTSGGNATSTIVDMADMFVRKELFLTNNLFTCGNNDTGQLGNGTTTAYSSPIQIGSLTNWKDVSCGYNHVHAIKSDGTLWSWGGNTYKQLGGGTLGSYSSPIQIGIMPYWRQVSAGSTFSLEIGRAHV